MRKKLFVQASAMAVLLNLIVPILSGIAQETSDVLPGGLSVGIFVRMHARNPGIQWILDSYKKSFLLDHMGDQAQAKVEDFSIIELKDASVGLFDALGPAPKMIVVSDMIPKDASITFKVKNMNFKLNIKERSAEKGLQPAIVKALLGAWVAAPDRTFLENEMAYSPALESEGRMCAYVVKANRIIVANDLSLAREALKYTAKGVPAASAPELKDFLRRFRKPQDFLFYLDNRGGFLSQLNAVLEKKLQIPLLTAADSLRCAGFFIDIVDKNHVVLRGTFIVNDPKDVAATSQDAKFLVEFFRRKLLVQKIHSRSRLQEGTNRVCVRMTLTNTSNFITEFLRKGRIRRPQKS